MIPNRNALWGRVVAQELARSGVRYVSLAPGSRSTPLVLGLSEEPELEVTTHWDERGAAFFALGAARAARAPAAVVTTSGTAAANLLPAAAEANRADVPLLLLTADRPPELHDVGANQTIDQQRIFGTHVRLFADAGVPEPRPARVRELRTLVDRAVAIARGPPAGPVHINFPFREPLEPSEVPGDVPTDWARADPIVETGRRGASFAAFPPPVRRLSPADEEAVASFVKRGGKGLIVVGPIDADEPTATAIANVGKALGWPVLADPLSGLRHRGAEAVVTAYDAFLASPRVRAALRPASILRLGPSPVSKNLLLFLKEARDAVHVAVNPGGRLGEETRLASRLVHADLVPSMEAIRARIGSPGVHDAWSRAWRGLDDVTHALHEESVPKLDFEGRIAHRLVSSLPDDALLVVSNSMPIRDVDRFGGRRERPLRVLCNRGASGIDGVLSTALGAAHAARKPTTLLVGDHAFLHDVNALAVLGRDGLPVRIVVVNNDGGGIFEFLPVQAFDPPYEERFVAPHGLDLAAVARSFGIAAHSARVGAEGDTALDEALAQRGPVVVEVRTDRRANVTQRRHLETALLGRLEPILAEDPRA